LAKAGFRAVEKKELAHDIQNNWYVVRKWEWSVGVLWTAAVLVYWS